MENSDKPLPKFATMVVHRADDGSLKPMGWDSIAFSETEAEAVERAKSLILSGCETVVLLSVPKVFSGQVTLVEL